MTYVRITELFDWFGRNHDAVGALVGIAGVVVAFLALCRPLIAGWFRKWKDWRELRAETRAIAAGLRMHVQAVADRATAARVKLSEYEHQPPKDNEWAVLNGSASLELPAQLDFLWQRPELASRPQIRPYADLAESVREYNNGRFLICTRDREVAANNWPSRWREMRDALSAVTDSAATLLENR